MAFKGGIFCSCGKEATGYHGGGFGDGDGVAICGVCMPSTMTTTSASNDFYEFANHSWLADETILIPAEYASWGSFIKLTDEALKSQIALLGDLVGKTADADQEKVTTIWAASMARFKAWEAGEGNCSGIIDELNKLNELVPSAEGETVDAYTMGLAKYISRCHEVGIGCPITFDKGANLKDSENIILDLSGSGLSLPSRDYYVDSKFDEQRGWFKEHLAKVADIIGADKLEPDFANKVIQLETKLAQISMKPDQSRQFDAYFSITTLDGLISDVNTLNHLKDKDANYAENKVDEKDADEEVLTSAEIKVGEDDLALIGKFWECLYKEMRLREVMVDSYNKNYPENTDAGEAQYRVAVFDGDYFRRVFQILFRSSNRSSVKAFMQYKIIRSASEFCTKALNEEMFDFFGRKLGGQKEQKTAEKRSIRMINSGVGELMGKAYVARFFSEDDKNIVHGLVKDVLAVMEISLTTNDWLTNETKEKALVKLSKFVVKLGYPDKWKDFSPLDLKNDDSLFVLHQKIQEFEYRTELLEKINTVKDKTKWEMNPQDVNAYFHPLNNEIVFPAAIMQPPFYMKSVDCIDFDIEGISADTPHLLAAANFGGIGAVIAHEITHGYDDQGRKFDSDGNINDWWQEQDAVLFKGKCALMAEQAQKWTFEDKPEEGAKDADAKVHTMNGELTMGENLADLGGMSLAFQALEKRCGDAMTNDHKVVFFRSWANVWKSKETKAHIIKALASDPHAPPSFRGNLVKNIDGFYDAFNVQPSDSMYMPPEKRVRMW